MNFLDCRFFRKLNKDNQNRGFTLVEIIVVIVIITIMAGVTVPAFLSYLDNEKERQCKLELKAFASSAVALYEKDYGQRHTITNDSLYDSYLDNHISDLKAGAVSSGVLTFTGVCPTGGTYTISVPEGAYNHRPFVIAVTCSIHGTEAVPGYNFSVADNKQEKPTDAYVPSQITGGETTPPGDISDDDGKVDDSESSDPTPPEKGTLRGDGTKGVVTNISLKIVATNGNTTTYNLGYTITGLGNGKSLGTFTVPFEKPAGAQINHGSFQYDSDNHMLIISNLDTTNGSKNITFDVGAQQEGISSQCHLSGGSVSTTDASIEELLFVSDDERNEMMSVPVEIKDIELKITNIWDGGANAEVSFSISGIPTNGNLPSVTIPVSIPSGSSFAVNNNGSFDSSAGILKLTNWGNGFAENQKYSFGMNINFTGEHSAEEFTLGGELKPPAEEGNGSSSNGSENGSGEGGEPSDPIAKGKVSFPDGMKETENWGNGRKVNISFTISDIPNGEKVDLVPIPVVVPDGVTLEIYGGTYDASKRVIFANNWNNGFTNGSYSLVLIARGEDCSNFNLNI